jgi:hypothetical protein
VIPQKIEKKILPLLFWKTLEVNRVIPHLREKANKIKLWM